MSHLRNRLAVLPLVVFLGLSIAGFGMAQTAPAASQSQTKPAAGSPPAGAKPAAGAAAPAAKKAAAKPAPATFPINEAIPGVAYTYIGPPSSISSGWKQPVAGCSLPGLPDVLSWLKVSCGKTGVTFSGTPPATATAGDTAFKLMVDDASAKSYVYNETMTVVAGGGPDYSNIKIDKPADHYVDGVQTIGGNIEGFPAGAQASQFSMTVETRVGEGNWASASLDASTPPPTLNVPAAGGTGSYSIKFAQSLLGPAAVRLTLLRTDTKQQIGSQVEALTLSREIRLDRLPQISLDRPIGPGATISGHIVGMPLDPVPPSGSGATASLGNFPEVRVYVQDSASKEWSAAVLTVPASASDCVVPGTTGYQPVDRNGCFKLTLATALKPGQSVRVDIVPPTGRSFQYEGPGDRMDSITEPVVATATLIRPSITSTPLTEGTTTISGTATPSSGLSVSVGVLRLRSRSDPAATLLPPCITADDTSMFMAAGGGRRSLAEIGDLLELSGSSNSLTASVDANTGAFTLTLVNALKQNDEVEIVQVLPNSTLLPAAEFSRCASPPLKVTYPFKLYRTNLDFIAGVLISNSSASATTSANFSQANQFYALDVDHAWMLPGHDCIDGKKWGAGKTCRGSSRDGWESDRTVPGVSTFFEGRLTSIPVSTAAASPTTTSSATSTSASSSGSTSSTSSSTPTLLTSQKVFRVEAGVYIPWVLTHGNRHHPEGLFVGPLAKVGFDTVTGAGTASNVVLPGNTVGTLNFQTAYKFYSFGGRLGNMALSAAPSRAPKLEHFLDVTIGRYSNLQSYICHTASQAGLPAVPTSATAAVPGGSSCPADYPAAFPNITYTPATPTTISNPANCVAGTGTGNYTSCPLNYGSAMNCSTSSAGVVTCTTASTPYVVDSRKALYRLDFEGLIHIPVPKTAIPFYIGFNANIAQYSVGATRLEHGFAPPDDIRILFATRIDIGSLLSTLNLGH